METIKLRDEFIKLGQALKARGLVGSGVEAKEVITEGLVKVNGEVDTRRGKKNYMTATLLHLTEKRSRLKKIGWHRYDYQIIKIKKITEIMKY